MARIDYAISVTPIQASQYDVTYDSAEAGTSTTNTDIDYVDPEIGRSLGGGNSSATWNGAAIADWGDTTAGEHEHAHAFTTKVEVGDTGDDMVWIKHKGIRYDATTADNLKADGTVDATVVSVYLGAAGSEVELCQLSKDEAIAIPAVKGRIAIGSANAAGPAVEWAKLT